jgi:hypothetical protein
MSDEGLGCAHLQSHLLFEEYSYFGFDRFCFRFFSTAAKWTRVSK